MRPGRNFQATAASCAGFLLFLGGTARAQRTRGELRIEVRDPQGQATRATGELLSEANQLRRALLTTAEGRCVAGDLPFGIYRIRMAAAGFAEWTALIEVRSEVPVRVSVTFGLAPVSTQVEVNDEATLVDPHRTGTIYTVGRDGVAEQLAAQTGRGLADLVNAEPGWLYEGNGVLHPRGSEYQVQYVLDGLPLTQNRSPAFAPAFDEDQVDSVRVRTASFPAEYGRKLGGIIELSTQKNAAAGLHGRLEAGGGSFESASGAAQISYTGDRNRWSAGGRGFHTGRYLDPPVLQNFTNSGNGGGYSAAYERDLSERQRLRVTLVHNQTRFLVPNELVQQRAGQRQDAGTRETSGQVYFQRTISPELFLSFSGSVRDARFTLASNPESTPIVVSQDRGYREGYARGDLAGHHGRHNWKTGADLILSPVREELAYRITDADQFDPETEQQFRFSERRWNAEPSLYAQDQVQLGNWTLNLGLRFDHYGFVVHESAWSPRVGVARYFPGANLLLHASYDRVFQTPAAENLLLASAAEVVSLSDVVLRLPVRPSRGNYYEGGFTKTLLGRLRVDGNVFRRDLANYADDDVLLATGVSFPIAFRRARIVGQEVKVEVPVWGRFSGFVSYSNQTGWGQGPVTGGLFLGEEASGALAETSRFSVSQDQRNTVRARLRFEASKRVWVATAAEYGSGLPAEEEGRDTDFDFLLAQYGPEILSRVNFVRGRVRPNFSLRAAAGVQIFRKEQRSAALQISAENLTGRLNVVNFDALFSGTAVAAPRSVEARLRLTF